VGKGSKSIHHPIQGLDHDLSKNPSAFNVLQSPVIQPAGRWVATLEKIERRSRNINTATSMSSLKSYSIHGRGLKLDSKEDIEPYLKDLRALKDVEEVHIGGKSSFFTIIKLYIHSVTKQISDLPRLPHISQETHSAPPPAKPWRRRSKD
jgi:hypothetical protein